MVKTRTYVYFDLRFKKSGFMDRKELYKLKKKLKCLQNVII